MQGGGKLTRYRFASQVVSDAAVIGGGVFERFMSELLPQLQIGAAVVFQRGQDLPVLLRAGGNGDMGMILRRCTHQTRAADIDLFDDLVTRRAGAAGRGCKRV